MPTRQNIVADASVELVVSGIPIEPIIGNAAYELVVSAASCEVVLVEEATEGLVVATSAVKLDFMDEIANQKIIVFWSETETLAGICRTAGDIERHCGRVFAARSIGDGVGERGCALIAGIDRSAGFELNFYEPSELSLDPPVVFVRASVTHNVKK